MINVSLSDDTTTVFGTGINWDHTKIFVLNSFLRKIQSLWPKSRILLNRQYDSFPDLKSHKNDSEFHAGTICKRKREYLKWAKYQSKF